MCKVDAYLTDSKLRTWRLLKKVVIARWPQNTSWSDGSDRLGHISYKQLAMTLGENIIPHRVVSNICAINVHHTINTGPITVALSHL